MILLNEAPRLIGQPGKRKGQTGNQLKIVCFFENDLFPFFSNGSCSWHINGRVLLQLFIVGISS